MRETDWVITPEPDQGWVKAVRKYDGATLLFPDAAIQCIQLEPAKKEKPAEAKDDKPE